MLSSGGPCSSKLAVIEVKMSYTTQQLDLTADYTINISSDFFSSHSWLNHQSNFTYYRKREKENESSAILWIFHNPTAILCAKCFYLKWFVHYQHSYIFFLSPFSVKQCLPLSNIHEKKHIIKSDKNKLFTMRYAHWDDECIRATTIFLLLWKFFKNNKRRRRTYPNRINLDVVLAVCTAIILIDVE